MWFLQKNYSTFQTTLRFSVRSLMLRYWWSETKGSFPIESLIIQSKIDLERLEKGKLKLTIQDSCINITKKGKLMPFVLLHNSTISVQHIFLLNDQKIKLKAKKKNVQELLKVEKFIKWIEKIHKKKETLKIWHSNDSGSKIKSLKLF